MATSSDTNCSFTFAPGETNVVADRFSPNILAPWLKTEAAASSMRVQYKDPNTLLGFIPLGSRTQTIPLRNIASVDTNVQLSVRNLIGAVVFAIAGMGCFTEQNGAAGGVMLLLVAALFALNVMKTRLDFVNQAGGRNSVTVSILEKAKLAQLATEIQNRVFADVEALRHQESMDMAQKQFTAQSNSVLIQQQMPDAQRAAQDRHRDEA